MVSGIAIVTKRINQRTTPFSTSTVFTIVRQISPEAKSATTIVTLMYHLITSSRFGRMYLRRLLTQASDDVYKDAHPVAK